MVKDYSDSEKGNPLPPHTLLLSGSSMGSRLVVTLLEFSERQDGVVAIHLPIGSL